MLQAVSLLVQAAEAARAELRMRRGDHVCVEHCYSLHRGCKKTVRVVLLPTRCVLLLLLLHNFRATQVMVIALLMLTLSLVPYLTGQLMDALTSTSTYQRRR